MNDELDMSPEAPLEGLLNKPMHLMTAEELRAHVKQIQTLRTSSQAMNAFRVEKKETATPSAFDEF